MPIYIDGYYYIGLINTYLGAFKITLRGKGPTYTKNTKPSLLVWFQSHPSRQASTTHEKQLKGWNRTNTPSSSAAPQDDRESPGTIWLNRSPVGPLSLPKIGQLNRAPRLAPVLPLGQRELQPMG